MAFVVFVQRTREISMGFSEWLKDQGHNYWSCEGPEEELGEDCNLHSNGGCSLWDLGSVFVYDPCLDTTQEGASTKQLVLALREKYPDKPMILMGPNPDAPDWAHIMAKEDPNVVGVLPASREGLRAAVAELKVPLGPGATAEQEAEPGERFERLSPR